MIRNDPFNLSYLDKMDAAVLAFFQQAPSRWCARRHVVACLPAYTVWQIKGSLRRLHRQLKLAWRKKRWRLSQEGLPKKIPKETPEETPEETLGITQEDLDWVRYWRQHRAERRARIGKECGHAL